MHTGWNYNKQQYMKQQYVPLDYEKISQHNARKKEAAKRRNLAVLAFSVTKYKKNDLVLLHDRDVVVIVGVEPKGYVVTSERHNVYGELVPENSREETIYRYRHIGKSYRDRTKVMASDWDGQTTEKYLSPIKG